MSGAVLAGEEASEPWSFRRPSSRCTCPRVLDVGHDDLAHQVRVARHRRESERHRRDAEADRKAGVAPAHLLADDPAVHRAEAGAAQLGREGAQVVAGLVGRAEHVAQAGVRRHHLLGRELIELRRRAHDLSGEA
jgi:hypothetical protein